MIFRISLTFDYKNTNNSPSLFSNLSDMLNQSHPRYQLADKIDGGNFLKHLFKLCIVRITVVPASQSV